MSCALHLISVFIINRNISCQTCKPVSLFHIWNYFYDLGSYFDDGKLFSFKFCPVIAMIMKCSWFSCKMNYLPLITNTRYHLKVYTYSREGWSYGSWIYNYRWNQCLSPLLLWVRTLFRQGVLNTLCIIIPYIIYKIKVMFLQNWYPRETSLLFTGRQMLCSTSVRKCIRFCIPKLQSWPEVKNTQISVYLHPTLL